MFVLNNICLHIIVDVKMIVINTIFQKQIDFDYNMRKTNNWSKTKKDKTAISLLNKTKLITL